MQDLGPCNKVQISISCRNLADLDLLSKSDPIVHVFLKDAKNKNYTMIGKTEIINNNLNPDFTKTFTIDYYFEKEQWVKFEVYDVDSMSLEHIGNCETTLSRIMTSQRQTFIQDLTLPDKPGKARGKIIVRADSVSDTNDDVILKASADLVT